ncbi:MAG: proteasome assembly chaperone 4 family protein [Promethearchaeota archaeon]
MVSGLEFVEEKVQVGRANIAVATCKLDNGFLILVSDGEYRFGTVAVGVPTPFGEISPTATSCLVGTRFQAAVRAMADIAALKLGGIVFVSLFLSKEGEAYVGSVLEAVRRLIVKRGEATEASKDPE